MQEVVGHLRDIPKAEERCRKHCGQCRQGQAVEWNDLRRAAAGVRPTGVGCVESYIHDRNGGPAGVRVDDPQLLTVGDEDEYSWK